MNFHKMSTVKNYFFSWVLRNTPTKYLRIILLKMLGATIGTNVNISSDIYFHMETNESKFSNLIINDGAYIGPRTFFDLSGKIFVEKYAVISMNCCILTHQDSGESKNRPMAQFYPKKISDIIIGEGSYICSNALILCGVKIGKMVVVGGGAVVTKDIPDYYVATGVPAKLLKKFDT